MVKVHLWDEFLTNEKVAELSDQAFRLYVLAIVYAGKELTDGFLSNRALKTLSLWTPGRQTRPLNELVSRGFLEQEQDGYRIHDYLKHQRSKAQVLADRQASADRQRKHREAKQAIEASLDNGVSHGVTDGVTDGVSHAVLSLSQPLTPKTLTSIPAVDVGDRSQANGDRPPRMRRLMDAIGQYDTETELRLFRALKNATEADVVAAIEACSGPKVQNRRAVALSELKKRKERAA